jgi:hypothetical protein
MFGTKYSVTIAPQAPGRGKFTLPKVLRAQHSAPGNVAINFKRFTFTTLLQNVRTKILKVLPASLRWVMVGSIRNWFHTPWLLLAADKSIRRNILYSM